jgi:hypothetical protein
MNVYIGKVAVRFGPTEGAFGVRSVDEPSPPTEVIL